MRRMRKRDFSKRRENIEKEKEDEKKSEKKGKRMRRLSMKSGGIHLKQMSHLQSLLTEKKPMSKSSKLRRVVNFV